MFCEKYVMEWMSAISDADGMNREREREKAYFLFFFLAMSEGKTDACVCGISL